MIRAIIAIGIAHTTRPIKETTKSNARFIKRYDHLFCTLIVEMAPASELSVHCSTPVQFRQCSIYHFSKLKIKHPVLYSFKYTLSSPRCKLTIMPMPHRTKQKKHPPQVGSKINHVRCAVSRLYPVTRSPSVVALISIDSPTVVSHCRFFEKPNHLPHAGIVNHLSVD